MGYRTAELPPVDLDEFATIPFFQRMKILQLHWVEQGFGTPRNTSTLYIWKLFWYSFFGLVFAGAKGQTPPIADVYRTAVMRIPAARDSSTRAARSASVG